MKDMKTIDKIGIPILFLGIFTMIYFMRDKNVDFSHYILSLAGFLVYVAVAVFLSMKAKLLPTILVTPITMAGLVVWFEYVTSGKTMWYLGPFVFLVSLCFHLFVHRKGKVQISQDGTHVDN
ncbi:MAG: hypothetical protein WCG75_04345 [Armatimonadota bacterium]